MCNYEKVENMTTTNILSLLGGLALFLYGMQMMGNGLEAAAGDRLKQILEKLTSNRFLGVIVGALVTAVIQSSSATTVMVVGFVNAQMMTLQQAVWIIGANVGTTITGQLIALDVSAIAPLVAFMGVALIMFTKSAKATDIGQIIAGLGILFIGMNMMSTAMMPLRESKEFVELVTHFSNPLVGILVGAGFTALIQSSSASVGILQALAASGVIGLDGAVYVLFGQNIGTCITAVLASIGTSREAKQATAIHLSFNIIGTTIFTIVCMFTPLVSGVIHLTPYNPTAQIANMHTIFNVCTTILLLPFGKYLAEFAQHILPVENKEIEDERLLYLQPLPKSKKMIGGAAISVKQINDETMHMLSLAYENVNQAFDQLLQFSDKTDEQIYKREDTVNYLDKVISEYISTALATPNLNVNISQALSSYYLMLVDIERISDYAVNMNHQATKRLQGDMTISEIEIIEHMKKLCEDMKNDLDDVEEAERKDDVIDSLVSSWREAQIQALKQKKCSSEVSMMLSRIFTDFERINDHALNVSQELDKITVEIPD